MNIKRSIFIILLIALLMFGFVSIKTRWIQETKVNEQTINAIADTLNKEYDSRHKLVEKLYLNGNPFDLCERELVDGVAFCSDYKKGLVINVYNSQSRIYCSYLCNVDSEKALELYLDTEVGENRPLFDLKSNWYVGENFKCWLSPNMRSKNDIGFTEHDDYIVAIFFMRDYVLILEQTNQGGNLAFDEYLSWFLNLITHGNSGDE